MPQTFVSSLDDDVKAVNDRLQDKKTAPSYSLELRIHNVRDYQLILSNLKHRDTISVLQIEEKDCVLVSSEVYLGSTETLSL